jgi:soluble lytic murein transglycosylase
MRRLRNILLAVLLGVLAWKGWRYWREHRFDSIIAQAAKRYGMDPALIRAVVWRESDFDPDARGRAGELGLMQIRHAAAMEWAAAEHVAGFKGDDCLDPLTNVLAGTWYLRRMVRHYGQADNPLPFGLAEYNAGRRNVLKWLTGGDPTNSAVFMDQIGFPGTRAYVRAILERYDQSR